MKHARSRRVEPKADAWLRTINHMLDDPDFAFASDFLQSVKEYVEVNKSITINQTAAILKIRRSTYDLED